MTDDPLLIPAAKLPPFMVGWSSFSGEESEVRVSFAMQERLDQKATIERDPKLRRAYEDYLASVCDSDAPPAALAAAFERIVAMMPDAVRVYRRIPYITKRVTGSRDELVRPVKERDKREWPREWAAFEATQRVMDRRVVLSDEPGAPKPAKPRYRFLQGRWVPV